MAAIVGNAKLDFKGTLATLRLLDPRARGQVLVRARRNARMTTDLRGGELSVRRARTLVAEIARRHFGQTPRHPRTCVLSGALPSCSRPSNRSSRPLARTVPHAMP